jgi:hypothetical protein
MTNPKTRQPGKPRKRKTKAAAQERTRTGRPTKFRIGTSESRGVCAPTVRPMRNWPLPSSGGPDTHSFPRTLRAAKNEFDDRVERAFAQRATGFHYPAVKVMQHRGKPVLVDYTEYAPPDVGACKAWLASRRPELWRDAAVVDASTTNNIQVAAKIDVAAVAAMLDADLALLSALLGQLTGDPDAAGSAAEYLELRAAAQRGAQFIPAGPGQPES